MDSDKKIQTAIVTITILTPVILGALYIGDMAGRLKTLEADRDYSAIKKERKKLFIQTDKKFEETKTKANEAIKLLKVEISLSKTELETYKNEKNILIEEFKSDIKQHTKDAKHKLNTILIQLHLKEKRLASLNKEIWKKKQVLKPINDALKIVNITKKPIVSVNQPHENIKKEISTIDKKYVIRIGVFSRNPGASRLQKDLVEAQFPAQIKQISNLYKVEVGPFHTKLEAENELKNIQIKFPDGVNAKEAYVLYKQ
ncbi:MAG: Unknown protein [uncultured Sulfurovum sp.]|uniref:SPOR domain-containing protein n=1 Tax=uncultured Sulfurovum sp. TaxID=269237 RepID=A0A6S6TTV9_9BACT|nr:MAG: Unknown protein [uncultured Sulfurovum sp.]